MVTMAQSTAKITRIHSQSHIYINTATTTWCEAPAQLLHNLESNLLLLTDYVCVLASVCMYMRV